VSLVDRSGKQVDLEAKDTEHLVAWLWGLNALLMMAGRHVELTDDAVAAPGNGAVAALAPAKRSFAISAVTLHHQHQR
jgi:hypothetical protein